MKNKFLISMLAILLCFVLSGCADDMSAKNSSPKNDTPISQSQLQNGGTQSSERISSKDAEKRAIEHSGFRESDVKGIRSELDFENGIYEYEVEFYVDNIEYDYKINALTGEVLSFDKDID